MAINIQNSRKFHLIIISIIITLSVVHFAISQLDFEDKPLFINFTLIGSITATLVMLAIIYRKYLGDRNIRVAFLFLFLSYVAYLTGEVLWFVYESILETYPYPSLADVGYFFYFVLTAIFLISSIRCFKIITRYDVGTVALIMSIIVSVYLVISLEAGTEIIDILYGLIFILVASSVFGFSGMALYKLKGSATLRLVWMIIFISMLITTIADLWYYTLENVEVYTYDHIINTMWITSDAVLVYALILYKRKS